MKDYIIVNDQTAEGLINKVNVALIQGYELQGGVTVLAASTTLMYSQAMVK